MFLLHVKSDEVKRVVLLWLLSAVLAMGFAMGWSAANTLLIKRVGIVYLPYAYVLTNVLGIIGSFVYILLSNRLSQCQLLKISVAMMGSVLLVAVLLLNLFSGGSELEFSLILFFLLVFGVNGLIGLTISMQVWSFADALFRPSEGTRIFPILGTALPIGGVIGGALINLLVSYIGVVNFVALWGCLYFVALGLVIKLHHSFGAYLTTRSRAGGDRQTVLGRLKHDVGAGFSFCWHYRLVRVLLFLVTCWGIVSYLRDYQCSFVFNATFPAEEDLNRYYGYYNVAINVTMILAQLFIAGRLLKQVGVGNGLFALPGAAFIGLSWLFISPSFLPALALAYFWDVVGAVMQGNAHQLIYTGVKGEYRTRARAFIGGIIRPLGGVLGSSVIIIFNSLLLHYHWLSAAALTLVALAVAVLWLFLANRTRRSYISSLIDNSKVEERRDALDSIDALGESHHNQAIRQLIELLTKSPKKEVQLAALAALGRSNSLMAVRYVTALLSDPDDDLRAAAIRSLVQLNKSRNQPFLKFNLRRRMEEMLRVDPSPDVRSEALAYMVSVHPDRNLPEFAAEMLLSADPVIRERTIMTLAATDLPFLDYSIEQFLKDPEPRVRAAAIKALHSFPERVGQILPPLRELLASAEPGGRLAGLKALPDVEGLDVQDVLAQLLKDEDANIRIFAALNYLMRSPRDGSSVTVAVDILVRAIGDPDKQEFLAAEIVPLLPDLPEECLDELLIEVAGLPLEGQKNLPALRNFFHVLEKREPVAVSFG